ncbi:MAG TPA: hypothetical protein VGP47_08355 [Parachlamydiaceae bacterium]|nr:hypothetical protein [Parachlamydiaceae bacterium]
MFPTSNNNPFKSDPSAFEIAKGFVTKGNEIGKEILANIRDTKMNAKWSERVAAPFSGPSLSIGKKALNFFHLGLVAAPALGGTALTSAVIKMLDKRENALFSKHKAELQGKINDLYMKKLELMSIPQSELVGSKFFDDGEEDLDKINNELKKLDERMVVVNEKLKVPDLVSERESLNEKRKIISNLLDNPNVAAKLLAEERDEITDKYLKKVDQAITTSNEELKNRSDNPLKLADRLNAAKTGDEKSMAVMENEDISNFIEEFISEKEEVSTLQKIDKLELEKGDANDQIIYYKALRSVPQLNQEEKLTSVMESAIQKISEIDTSITILQVRMDIQKSIKAEKGYEKGYEKSKAELEALRVDPREIPEVVEMGIKRFDKLINESQTKQAELKIKMESNPTRLENDNPLTEEEM